MGEISVVIPAYNEASRIGPTVEELVTAYPVFVVDDGSTDDTIAEARTAGARVIQQPRNEGPISALKRGFQEAAGEVIVTYDADGEHRPEDVERLADPVVNDQLDLVLGARASVPRYTEKILNSLIKRRVGVSDSYTGFRALSSNLANNLDLQPPANCGTLVLEAAEMDARIGECEITTRSIEKPRGIAWHHGREFIQILQF